MTNDLTAQHLEAIINNTHLEYEQDSAMVVGNPIAATSCAAITVEWMKNVLEWATKFNWHFEEQEGLWYYDGFSLDGADETPFTTDELINLYLKSLQTPKP